MKHFMNAALSLLFAGVPLFAGQAEYDAYKQKMKGDKSLIRFYTFEEGHGTEVHNLAQSDSRKIAVTGGPLHSMSINRVTPYGMERAGLERYVTAPQRPAEWTQGRFPWKPGLLIRDQVYNLFRSGYNGRDSKTWTFAGWVRIRPNEQKQYVCNIFGLGNAYHAGFRLSFARYPWAEKGQLVFQLGGKTDVLRVSCQAVPFEPGLWHHFAVTHDGEKISLYVDGRKQAEKDYGAVTPVLTARFISEIADHEHYVANMDYLRIGFRRYPKDKMGFFDIDEFMIFNRAVPEQEIAELERAGRPAGSGAEQLAVLEKISAKEKMLAGIQCSIPKESNGYFRIGDSIPATVSLPDSPLLNGKHLAVFRYETLQGQLLAEKKLPVEKGKTVSQSYVFPKCGAYYIDMMVLDSSGKTVMRLPEKFGIGICPPKPGKITGRNPVGLWACGDRFNYDTQIRRMSAGMLWMLEKDRFQYFIDDYKRFCESVPGLRTVVVFAYPPGMNKKLTPEERKFWTGYYQKAAEALKGRYWGIEFTSEPNHVISPERMAELLKIAVPIFRKELPGVKIFPPGGTPFSLPFIAKMLECGTVPLLDGISYHTYRNNPIMASNLTDITRPLRNVLGKYRKKLDYYNTESGFFALPRVSSGRPMTRAEARAAGFPVANSYGFELFSTTMPVLPEEEAAALQVHSVLVELSAGFKTYIRCQSPNLYAHISHPSSGQPGLVGVAYTTLAGQVLNDPVKVEKLSLSSLDMACFLVHNADGSRIAAICGMKENVLNFRGTPGAGFKTMDMLGNPGSIKADANGMLTVNAGMNPVYLFGVPANFREVAALKLELPEVLPENGKMQGKVTVSNDFKSNLRGTLSVLPVRGAEVRLSKTGVDLSGGRSETVAFDLNAVSLKHRIYPLTLELRSSGGKLLAAASATFQSNGVTHKIPQMKRASKLNGDLSVWKNVPETVCDTTEDVVYGKPNFAELWLPQWRNRDDLSFSVKLAWVKHDAVYFLVNVRDNKLFPPPEGRNHRAFTYDCLELFLDTRPEKSLGSPVSEGADQVIVPSVDSASAEPSALWHVQKNPYVKVSAVGRKTPHGWLIEGKIAPTEKSSLRILPGSRFMMDFLVDDTDSEKELRKSAMALHGIFENYARSDVWGRYILSLEKVKE